MLSRLALFSQGLLGCRWRRGVEERRNIRFPVAALDVTTLIIDLGEAAATFIWHIFRI